MITFRALGLPAAQGSKRAYVVGNRAVVVENNKHTQRSWRTAVAETAHQHRPETPLDGPLLVRIELRMPRPKARRRALWADRKPDIDKLTRNVLDALVEAGMIIDDSRVCELQVIKYYADPYDPWTGAQISVSKLEAAA